MKIFLKSLLIPCLLLCKIGFTQNVKQVNSTIKEATVFVNGAELTRTAQVNLSVGQNILHLTGLSQYAQIDQLRLSTSKNVTLASSAQLNDYLTEVKLSDEAESLKERLDEAELKYGVRIGVKEAYEAEKKLITSNQSILGEGALDVTDLTELANLYRSRLKEINIKLLEISREATELKKEVDKLRRQFNEAGGNKRNNSHKTFEFIVMANAAGITTIEFSYFVGNVAWVPEYDVSLNTNNTLNLKYKATILQNTGIHWDNVNVNVSTGKPMNSNSKPALYTLYVNYLQEPRPYANVRTAKKLNAVAYEGELAEVALDEVAYDYAEQISGLTTEIFKLPGKYSISGNGKPFSVSMKENNLQADIQYYAVPKYAQQAYLVAKVKPIGLDGLLPGKAHCYNNGQLTGTSYFNPFGTEDDLLLTLGTDADIEVKRKSLIESQNDGNIISSNKKEYRYQISISNKKNKAIKLLIEDQIPIPQNTDIVVTSDNLSGGQLNQSTGIVKWTLDIPAQDKQELKNFYTIKFPKGKRINH